MKSGQQLPQHNWGSHPSDKIVTMTGIGGKDRALRKQIERPQFDDFMQDKPLIDFGNLEAHPGTNGLLGTDVLIDGYIGEHES